MILRRVITKGDKTNTEVFWLLELARLENVGTDGFDILCCR